MCACVRARVCAYALDDSHLRHATRRGMAGVAGVAGVSGVSGMAGMHSALLHHLRKRRLSRRHHRPELGLARLLYTYRLYLGIADGISIARIWACWYSK